MASPAVMTGARAKVRVAGKLVGIFNSVSYGLTYDVQPAYVLGRFDAAATDYTGQEVINISASGWRVVGTGAHEFAGTDGGSMPKLGELLSHQEITFEIFDRAKNDKPICKITGVRPVSYSTSINARSLSELQMNFVGRSIQDESETDTRTNKDIGSAPDLGDPIG